MAQRYSTVASNAVVQGSILGISIFCWFFFCRKLQFLLAAMFLARRSLVRARGPV